ncbi:MAG: SAM-dependent chlorinase/fluorinase [Armatimonadetes bacterium]|nr:SAM-dependent chlorinase/fluorinase [Armatimonadota bacterium]MDW8123042.1 SAM-dependent chlorinase/fluorinase [Armatimonadota bacterium]
MPVVALLTDFGDRDIYVGVMKGVIAQICPQAQTIDLTHQVAPYDISGGALALWGAYRYFPRGTVFCCIVDPGVGSQRRPIAVQSRDYCFVGPDNGLFWWVLDEEGCEKVVEIQNKVYWLPIVSRTFHGRDIFAPIAAHLAKGIPVDDLGPEIEKESLHRLPPLRALIGKEQIVAEVVHIDRFGNAITNLREEDFADWVQELGWRSWQARIAGVTFSEILSYYGEAKKGEPLLLFNSFGLLEIAVREGSAQKDLGIEKGRFIEIVPVDYP